MRVFFVAALTWIALLLIATGVVRSEPRIRGRDPEIVSGSFQRASRWLLLSYTPGTVILGIGSLTALKSGMRALLITAGSILISIGFVIGFCLFYVREKALRDRRRAERSTSSSTAAGNPAGTSGRGVAPDG
jgi:hypothetical protein